MQAVSIIVPCCACAVGSWLAAGCWNSRGRRKGYGSILHPWTGSGCATDALPVTMHSVPSRTAAGAWRASDVAVWQFTFSPRNDGLRSSRRTLGVTQGAGHAAVSFWGSCSASSPVPFPFFPLCQHCDSCHFTAGVGLNLVIVTHTINTKFFHFLCSFTAAIHFFIIIISKPRLLQGPLCNPGYVYGSLQSAFHTHTPVLFLEQTHLLMASLVISVTVCVSTQKLSTKIKFCLPE